MNTVVKSPNLIPAVYKHGIFEPVAPIPGLFDDQPVQLQIWPVTYAPVAYDGLPEEWSKEWYEDDEWAALTVWEQQGLHSPFLAPSLSSSLSSNLPPIEATASLQWVYTSWGSLALPHDHALEIATDDWLTEDNLWL